MTSGAGSYRFPVRATDTDWNDRLHLPALFSLMQEAAIQNAHACGWGTAEMDPLGVRWVLTRVAVRMQTFPTWQDTLCVETWPRGLERLLFLRDFAFSLPGSGTEGTGVRMGGASSSWVLVDMRTRRPRRPDILPARPEYEQKDRRALGWNAKIVPAQPEAVAPEPVLIKHADACDIDRNLHVNNTRYVTWCVDAVYRQAEDHPLLTGIDIQYLAEARFGDQVHIGMTIQHAAPARRFYVHGSLAKESKPLFRAILYEGKRTEMPPDGSKLNNCDV